MVEAGPGVDTLTTSCAKTDRGRESVCHPHPLKAIVSEGKDRGGGTRAELGKLWVHSGPGPGENLFCSRDQLHLPPHPVTPCSLHTRAISPQPGRRLLGMFL